MTALRSKGKEINNDSFNNDLIGYYFDTGLIRSRTASTEEDRI
jgi:hypothetical protein